MLYFFVLLSRLEQDSGIFFNSGYFSNAILSGNLKDAENYLSAFTSPDVDTYSRKMFFDLFKWKFSEAPDRQASPTLLIHFILCHFWTSMISCHVYFLYMFSYSFLVMFCRSGGSESVNIFSKDLRRLPVFKDDGFDDLVEVIAVEDIRQGFRYINTNNLP